MKNFFHHSLNLGDANLHYVSCGQSGTPVILVHGFPETWWAFSKLMPILASRHRVCALDIRGFGISDPAKTGNDSATVANDLKNLIDHLGVGPVHLLTQDISGAAAFRLASRHPEKLLSLTAVEAGLAGFGLEAFADITQGGAWYIGVLATPGAADVCFGGRERQLIGDFIMPMATANREAVTGEDVHELSKGYNRPHGWSGAEALYRSMLKEGADLRKIADTHPLSIPTLVIDRAGSDFTVKTWQQVHRQPIVHRTINDVGHYIAMEAPDKLAAVLLPFLAEIDERPCDRAI